MVMARKGRDRQNQSGAEPEKDRAGRALTVCAAERGHGEHEPTVQVASPPEAAALPRVTTSARRWHFQRAQDHVTRGVSGVASMRS
jgi:hypothetical protein